MARPENGPGGLSRNRIRPQLTFTGVNFVLHAGSRPRDQFGRDNPFDLSAYIPADSESQLRIEWTTSGNDILDDSVTISSGVMRFILHRVIGTDAEIRAEMAKQGVVLPAEPGVVGMVPAWSAVVHANAGTTTDFFAETEDVVVGAFLKRISLLCQDSTVDRTLRAQDEVTRIAPLRSPSWRRWTSDAR